MPQEISYWLIVISAVRILRNRRPPFHGVPTRGSTQRSSPIHPAFRQANTNHVAIANSIPLVDADPAIIKFQFIIPPKNAANPVQAPKIRPKAMATSPKIITLESQVGPSELTKNSINHLYQSKAITGFGVILRPLCQYSRSAWPPSIHFGSTNLCHPASHQAQPR